MIRSIENMGGQNLTSGCVLKQIVVRDMGLTRCRHYVNRLLSLLPIKHSEKIMRRELAFQLKDTVRFWEEAKPKVLALRSRIREGVRRCIQEAEIEYGARSRKKEVEP